MTKQMNYLDYWAVLERDHIDALSGAVEDLEASTLRLPVNSGAMVSMVVGCFFDLITEERHCFHYHSCTFTGRY